MKNKVKNSPSVEDLLLATLLSGKSVHRFRAIIRERQYDRYKPRSIQVALFRLQKKNYVQNHLGNWVLTQKGKKYRNNITILGYHPSPFKKNSPKNTIISFDIPESKRKIRNWLRNQIKIFDYEMLQQSLWKGPGPLPSAFFKQLENLNIRKNVKILSNIKSRKNNKSGK